LRDGSAPKAVAKALAEFVARAVRDIKEPWE
jgi:hypothetical protein